MPYMSIPYIPLQDVESGINIVVALAGVVGTLLTAAVTYLITRSQIRNEDRRTKIDETRAGREEKFVGVEAAERLSNITIQYTQQMYSQLTDCIAARTAAEEENKQLRNEILDVRLRNRKIAAGIRRIIDEHDKIAKDNGQLECPGRENINNLIRAVADELDPEVNNDPV